jgi:hypothetical protein
MWEEFTFEQKSKCVLEEAYVIGLERKILPMMFGGKSYFSSQEASLGIDENLHSFMFRMV